MNTKDKSINTPVINTHLESVKTEMDSIREKTPNYYPFFIFRGHSNYGYPVSSAAYRRLESFAAIEDLNKLDIVDSKSFNRLKEHDIKLLDDAKLKGHHKLEGGRKLQDLELLSDLRHYGSPTSLIDFTSNFLTALFFACGGYDKNEKFKKNNSVSKEQDKETSLDGEIFVMDVGNPSLFLKVNHELLEKRTLGSFFDTVFAEQSGVHPHLEGIVPSQKVRDIILYKKNFWYWVPERLNERMRDQDCVFVFGSPIIQKSLYKSIKIPALEKPKILKELNEIFGYNLETLFSDRHGFAEHYKRPDSMLDVEYHYRLGMESLLTSNKLKAEKCFQDSLEVKNSKMEPNEKNKIFADAHFRLAEIASSKIRDNKKYLSENSNINKEGKYEIILEISSLSKEMRNHALRGHKFDKSHKGLKSMLVKV